MEFVDLCRLFRRGVLCAATLRLPIEKYAANTETLTADMVCFVEYENNGCECFEIIEAIAKRLGLRGKW